MTAKRVLVLDVGTTGIKAFVFSDSLRQLAKAYSPIRTDKPRVGWREQDPLEIFRVSVKLLKQVAAQADLTADECLGLGLTNQRETVILWDKKTGRPIYPAIVWEDVRTKGVCAKLKKEHEALVSRTTGLTLDPYFSATKIQWILQHVPAAKKLLAHNRLAAGTVDSWLIFKLAENQPHLTDYTNASRTLLLNLKTLEWDEKMMKLFNVPAAVLPDIQPSASLFGHLDHKILGWRVPILAVVGDQQASFAAASRFTIHDSRFTTKVTYGTGAFLMQELPNGFISHPPFFTTLVPDHGQPRYALEAKVGVCGDRVKPVLDNPPKLRRVLTAIAKQVDAYVKLLPRRPKVLITDGGVARDGIITSLQEDISGIKVVAQKTYDGTALGAAGLVLEFKK